MSDTVSGELRAALDHVDSLERGLRGISVVDDPKRYELLNVERAHGEAAQ